MSSIVPVAFPAPLSGSEMIRAFGVSSNGQPSGEDFYLSTGQIAALASTDSSFTSTSITTAGNGTLTAAGLVGGQIVRTGPTGAYTDTTATAAQIVAAGGVAVGGAFKTVIKNATAFVQTISAGAGVTLPLTVIIPPFSEMSLVGQVVSATAVTFLHIGTTAVSIGQNLTLPTATALATVGAGTITAASFAGGFTNRTGSTTAFTDTTDTAANIIAACANLVNKIGTAITYRYVNNTVAVATIGGGTGVTVAATVPANSWADFIVTYTAAATLVLTLVGQAYFPSNGTYVNNGSTPVTVANTAVTAGSIIVFTLKTVGGTVSASAPNVKTITPGTGFTVAGLASDTSTYNYEIRG